MPKFRTGDILNDPLKLLAQYRDICENMGGLRAIGSVPPKQLEERLARVESQLKAHLSQDDGPVMAPAGTSRATPMDHPTVSPPRLIPEVPTPPGIASDAVPDRPASPEPGAATTARVFSDGACIRNPGPGGYAALVRVSGRQEKVVTGGKSKTTNNEMEMTAAIEGLRSATAAGAIEIAVFSDSEYLVKGMNEWMKGWLRNGWKTRTGHPVKNRELWEELHWLAQGRAVTWSWVAGHAGHRENELCDRLAVEAAKKAAGPR
ncbi:MAG TPA: ribonuclease HI [Chloroflexota bacterium]